MTSAALTSAALPSASPGVFQFERHAEVINTSPRESDTDRCTRQEFEDRFAMKFVDDASAAAKAAEQITADTDQVAVQDELLRAQAAVEAAS